MPGWLWFRDVRRSFKQGVVCGFVSKDDHRLHLNPRDQETLEWGDRLIVLANDGAHTFVPTALHPQV